MSVVGKVVKQPAEIESYSVLYDDDLSPTEQVVSAFNSIYNVEKKRARRTVTANVTLIPADAFTQLLCGAGVTVVIPTTMLDGDELYIANSAVSGLMSFACADLIDGSTSIPLPPNQSVVITRIAGTWMVTASAINILVNSPGDHRSRVFFYFGLNGLRYQIEITADTNESRRIQDEIRVTVKEI